MRCLPPGEQEAAWRSVPDRLSTGQAVHTDAPPTPIVDEPLKRLAKSINNPRAVPHPHPPLAVCDTKFPVDRPRSITFNMRKRFLYKKS